MFAAAASDRVGAGWPSGISPAWSPAVAGFLRPGRGRVSALPASVFWSGSHQLWFETVYCTKESFENEVEATDRLGWVAGTVLRDLAREGILKTVNRTDLLAETRDRLRRTRDDVIDILPADRIRYAIQTGDARTLEPVLDLFGCFESGAPNSISNWIPAAHPDPADAQPAQPSTVAGLLNCPRTSRQGRLR
jgi:hypothetical protein